jgi:small-conductance mechanosensitive channel
MQVGAGVPPPTLPRTHELNALLPLNLVRMFRHLVQKLTRSSPGTHTRPHIAATQFPVVVVVVVMVVMMMLAVILLFALTHDCWVDFTNICKFDKNSGDNVQAIFNES